VEVLQANGQMRSQTTKCSSRFIFNDKPSQNTIPELENNFDS